MEIELSATALSLLRRRFAREPVEVTEETRPAYRELAAAGLMEPVHTFARGRDSHYRLTRAAVELRDKVSASSPSPSPEESVATLS
jgi:hypothetical protein